MYNTIILSEKIGIQLGNIDVHAYIRSITYVEAVSKKITLK